MRFTARASARAVRMVAGAVPGQDGCALPQVGGRTQITLSASGRESQKTKIYLFIGHSRELTELLKLSNATTIAG